MKYSVLCDNALPETVVDLFRRPEPGVEEQAFYHPAARSDAHLLREAAGLVADLTLIVIQGPYGDLNTGSFDPLVRETARRRIQQGYTVALALGADHVVYHHSRVPGTGPESAWATRVVQFWNAFMEQVRPDVTIYLENMLEQMPNVLCSMLDGVGRPNYRANLDGGHAHCHSPTPLVDSAEALGPRNGYVHLHDNDAERDQHRASGQGTVPMYIVCHAPEEHAPEATWAIEVEGEGLLESLEWLDQRGFLKPRAAEQ